MSNVYTSSFCLISAQTRTRSFYFFGCADFSVSIHAKPTSLVVVAIDFPASDNIYNLASLAAEPIIGLS